MYNHKKGSCGIWSLKNEINVGHNSQPIVLLYLFIFNNKKKKKKKLCFSIVDFFSLAEVLYCGFSLRKHSCL